MFHIPINLHESSKAQSLWQLDPNLPHTLQLFLSGALVSFQVKEHELIAVLLAAV